MVRRDPRITAVAKANKATGLDQSQSEGLLGKMQLTDHLMFPTY